MRLIKPTDGPLSGKESGPSRASHRPRWLTEWIANKSRYVLMRCGHKENIGYADSAIALINAFDAVQLYCEKCKDFSAIERSMSFLEYMGIPKPVYPDTPPF